MHPILTVFLPSGKSEDLKQTLQEFMNSGLKCRFFVLGEKSEEIPDFPIEVEYMPVSSMVSSESIRKIASHAASEYTLFYTKQRALKLGIRALHRMMQVAESTGAGIVYSDYYALKEGRIVPNPVIEYQKGSIRDDFNFGSLLMFKTKAFIEAVSRMNETYTFAGLYDLRLKLSQKHDIFCIPEYLYTEVEQDIRKSGEKLFDYVDPGNRQVQIEMEKACTAYLKESRAWLEPRFRKIQFDKQLFDVEASVIIPVKNRAKTIGDAIESVLLQKTSFDFNLIVVDNHSDDGTGEIIRSFSGKDNRLIHVIPQRSDLGIGGCWNEAVFHPACGKFAVQLDSDDLYIDEHVLAHVVEAFYAQNCAMIVGTYKMVNFDLGEIPPGIIDHREWTPENGRNNALRINGLGAPRAFYTPVLRNTGLPDVSYGEDYALGLTISRYYQIGRIYEPLYLCRRWAENSDASLDIPKMNAHNFYKDKIRTIEFIARQQYVREGQKV